MSRFICSLSKETWKSNESLVMLYSISVWLTHQYNWKKIITLNETLETMWVFFPIKWNSVNMMLSFQSL